MKKITKKIISYFLVFCLILTPLLFTGCIDLLGIIDGFEESPTFYIGGVHSSVNVTATAHALGHYESQWTNSSQVILDILKEEYSNSDDFGDRKSRSVDSTTKYQAVSNRTDYLPDYRELFGAKYEMDLSTRQTIAKNLSKLKYCALYSDGRGSFVLALTDDATINEEGSILAPSGDPVSGAGALMINKKYVTYAQESGASSNYEYRAAIGAGLEKNILGYSGTNGISKLGENEILYKQWEPGYKVFYFSAGGSTQNKRHCLFVIGNYADRSMLGKGNTITECSKSYIQKIYKTNYDKMNFVVDFNEDNYDLKFEQNKTKVSIFKSSGWKVNLSNMSPGSDEITIARYDLANKIIKNLFFDTIETKNSSIYRTYPTAITWQVLNEMGIIEAATLKDEYISKISLGDIYDMAKSGLATNTITSKDGTESITLVDEQWNFKRFFLLCTYQFLNGIPGYSRNIDNENMVADIILKDYIGETAQNKELADSGKRYINFLTEYIPVRVKSSTSPVQLWPILHASTAERQLTIDENTDQNIALISSLNFAEIDKKYTRSENGFLTQTRYKYHSFVFEAWGRNYSIDSFVIQLRYLTDEEKEENRKNGVVDEKWKALRDHYTFSIQHVWYNENGRKIVKEWVFKTADGSSYFDDADLQDGLLIFEFQDAFTASKDSETKQINFRDQKKHINNLNTPFSAYTHSKINEYSRNGSALIYSERGTGDVLYEDYVQLIFGVDSEANRIDFSIDDIWA